MLRSKPALELRLEPTLAAAKRGLRRRSFSRVAPAIVLPPARPGTHKAIDGTDPHTGC